MSPNRPESSSSKRYLPFVIIGGVLALVIAGVVLLSRQDDGETAVSRTTNAGAPANASAPAAPARRQEKPGAQPPQTKGPQYAPVFIEEFSDFQCPACARVHPFLKNVEKEYGDRVRVVFRHFPLQQLHKNAFSAARAAEAAGQQGKFWQMHDMLFENQKEWGESPEPRPIFAGYAGRLGLNVEKFRADMERQDLASRVVADYERGMSLNIKGTPTLFLNGREMPAERTMEEASLRAEVEAALGVKNQ